MNKEQYLSRMGIESDKIEPNVDNLRFLQRQHLLSVPFENLDIHWRRPITLNYENFFKKIVGEKRGGFCYELNGLFYWLLGELGFQCRIISARVRKGNDQFGPEYDHLAILTSIGDEEYLVDVGFGSFIAEPLKFICDSDQIDQNGIFLIKKRDDIDGGDYFEVLLKDREIFKSEFIFMKTERDLSEFAEMCYFHQTSPESHFTRGKLCSLMTEGGRKTLTETKFIETNNNHKTELSVNSETEFNQILLTEFKIVPNLQ